MFNDITFHYDVNANTPDQRTRRNCSGCDIRLININELHTWQTRNIHCKWIITHSHSHSHRINQITTE